jgi:hypothetical protein
MSRSPDLSSWSDRPCDLGAPFICRQPLTPQRVGFGRFDSPSGSEDVEVAIREAAGAEFSNE